MDAFEETLRRVGRASLVDDLEVRRALDDLADAQARAGSHRRRRLALPVVIAAGAALLGGAGAMAATQFGPWTTVTDPDYVVTRDWYDVEGTYLGTCESHVRIEHESPEVLAEARRLLAALDLDDLPPDPTWVALWLASWDRLGDYPRLIGGDLPDPSIADLAPLDASGDVIAYQTDARILQLALLMTVHNEISADLQAAGLDAEFAFTGEGETYCSSDPGPWPAS